eukprot:427243-Rhodomonas_salina.1
MFPAGTCAKVRLAVSTGQGPGGSDWSGGRGVLDVEMEHVCYWHMHEVCCLPCQPGQAPGGVKGDGDRLGESKRGASAELLLARSDLEIEPESGHVTPGASHVRVQLSRARST